MVGRNLHLRGQIPTDPERLLTSIRGVPVVPICHGMLGCGWMNVP